MISLYYYPNSPWEFYIPIRYLPRFLEEHFSVYRDVPFFWTPNNDTKKAWVTSYLETTHIDLSKFSDSGFRNWPK